MSLPLTETPPFIMIIRRGGKSKKVGKIQGITPLSFWNNTPLSGTDSIAKTLWNKYNRKNMPCCPEPG